MYYFTEILISKFFKINSGLKGQKQKPPLCIEASMKAFVAY